MVGSTVLVTNNPVFCVWYMWVYLFFNNVFLPLVQTGCVVMSCNNDPQLESRQLGCRSSIQFQQHCVLASSLLSDSKGVVKPYNSLQNNLQNTEIMLLFFTP